MLVQQLSHGLSRGLVYAPLAVGLTLICGVLNLLNLARGRVHTLGACAALAFAAISAPRPWAWVLFALAIAAALGFGPGRIAFRRTRPVLDEATRKVMSLREATVLFSLALSIIVRDGVETLFGSGAPMEQMPIGTVTWSMGEVAIFSLSLAMLAGLTLLLCRTSMGLTIRAMAHEPVGAMVVGLNIGHALATTFAVVSMLGAASGIVAGFYRGAILPAMGVAPGVKAFIAMAMGGPGSIVGAAVCALILGVAEAVTTTFLTRGWSELAGCLFLIAALVLFPSGIFGRSRERV